MKRRMSARSRTIALALSLTFLALLWVDIGYVEEQIQKYGGTSDNPDTTRSLYPYFFSPREEAGIHGRLVSLG